MTYWVNLWGSDPDSARPLAMKLYIITRSDLRAGLLAAQACHAAAAFCLANPVRAEEWRADCNLVVLATHNGDELERLAASAEQAGHEITRFHEPDLEGALTAIAGREELQPLVSSLPLALRAA